MANAPVPGSTDVAEPGPERPVERGTVSVFLAQLAAAPERELTGAWERGLRSGDVVGRFQILREVGRGGFGVVYEARDSRLKRLVAFKAMRARAGAHARMGEEWLQREAEAAAQLSHPNIVTVHDVGASPHGPYLILEMLTGETLAERLRGGPLGLEEALRVAFEVAAALEHAHASGVVHGDLKPSNVFLTAGGQVKVLDFGLARTFGTSGGAGGGTPGYAPPEQWRGESSDARADVYGAAAMLLESLTGRLPAGPSRGGRPEPPAAAGLIRPAPLAALLASALADHPAARPAGGRAWREALASVQAGLRRGRPRRGARVALALALAALAGAAAALALRRLQAPAPPVPVAVADAANATGEPDLAGISGLLATSLEQSRRLTVLTRARMGDVLRQLGQDPTRTVDEVAGREVAMKAGARVLLVPSIGKLGDGYRIDLKGLDPASEGYLFALGEQAGGKAAIPEALDRLSERVRLRLQERPAEVRAARVSIADSITRDLGAYAHYVQGVRCQETVGAADCGVELRRALALDPIFALAHARLAYQAQLDGEPPEEQRAAVDAALRFGGRLPRREGLLVAAIDAQVRGQGDEALASLERAVREYPQDKWFAYLAGDFLYHRDEYAGCIPHLERALGLDPTFGWALDHLVFALGLTGRMQDLAAWRRRWEAERPTPDVLRAVHYAYLWPGDFDSAIAYARRAVAAGGGLEQRQTLAAAYVFKGDLAAGEAETSALLRPEAPPDVRVRGLALVARLRALQGRRREALRLVEAMRPLAEAPRLALQYHRERAVHLLGDGQAAAAWGEIQEVRRLVGLRRNFHADGSFAGYLAWLGDVEHARLLADEVALDSPSGARFLEALVAWRLGRPGDAVATLRDLDRHAAVYLNAGGLPPSLALARIHAERGEDAAALEMLRRFQSIHFANDSWPWTYPRSFLLQAQLHERRGERGQALAAVGVLLGLWREADPDLPLLAEARALRDRVADPR